MWRRIVVVCAVPLALLTACGGEPESAPQRPASRTTTTTTTTLVDNPASDAQMLSALLGPVSPRCPQGTTRTSTACGEVLSSAKKLVDIVDVALDSMPTTGAYAGVNEAVSSFNDAYSTLESTACYTPDPVGGVDDAFCQTLSDLVSLAWLNLQSNIDQLG
jgi:hypothetical protein